MYVDKPSDSILQSVSYFLRQDYPAKELLIITETGQEIDLPLPLGGDIRLVASDHCASDEDRWQAVLNNCRGRYIAAWDASDWIGSDRLSRQTEEIEHSDAAGCAAAEVAHYSPVQGRAWQLATTTNPKLWRKTLLFDRTRADGADFGRGIFAKDRCRSADCAKSLIKMVAAPWYVVITHTGVPLSGAAKSIAVSEIARMISSDRTFYSGLRSRFVRASANTRTQHPRSSNAPTPGQQTRHTFSSVRPASDRVSCLMPTRNRRGFVSLAIQCFLNQDYPDRELIIVDDGAESVKDLLPDDPRIQYCRLLSPRSIGTKRNVATELAKGEFFICWDDDDWYAPDRISRQVAPLLARGCHVTALDSAYILDLPKRQFLKKDRSRARTLFNWGASWGTLAWTREWWDKGIRFPDSSAGEDVALKEMLVRSGARVTPMREDDLHLYVRHGANTWRFSAEDAFKDGWSVVSPPGFLPADLLRFYGLPDKSPAMLLQSLS
jgi:hypothetical protein